MPSSAPLPTLVFGHYEVLRQEDGRPCELGRGAMGITYKARDTALHRFVALKVINPEALSGDSARERFLREARAAGCLKHPNVASVFHLGEEGGVCFYAMEFVDGETAESLVRRRGPLPCALALEIAAQVAGVLAAAHTEHLVHRDIKPSNLMIAHDPNGQPVVKVIDFGLAKSSVAAGAHDAALTIGGFLGTPHFASPEQLEEGETDIRSDIYSLGATLWYLLTGATLFAGSMARVMIGHLNEKPPVARLEAPAELRALLERLLEKQPADRPHSPLELALEIRRIAAGIDADFVCPAVQPSTGGPGTLTLRDILRVRRYLPVDEVLVLLEKLVSTLDLAGPRGHVPAGLNVHSISIFFANPASDQEEDWARLPVSRWPDFYLQPGVHQPQDTTVGEQTVVRAPTPARDFSQQAALAAIVYELLGGKLRVADGAPVFVPLAALSEEGNAVLRAALNAQATGRYRTIRDFFYALKSAEQPHDAVMRPAATGQPRTTSGNSSAAARKHRSLVKVGALGVAALLVIVGGTVLAIRFGWGAPDMGESRVAEQTHSEPKREPASASPEVLSEDRPAPPAELPKDKPEPVVPSPPVPVLDRGQQLKIAIGETAEYETAGDWKNALSSSLRLVKEFPEYEKGSARLDGVIDGLVKSGALRRDREGFLPPITEAADLGSGPAILLVAERLRKTDPAAALTRYRQAADKGVAHAMTQIGHMYLQGEGVVADAKEAEAWFGKASALNDPSGTFALAECYLAGRGVKQDKAKAVALLQDASDHKSGEAKNLLGKLSLNGQAGFPVNKLNAAELFRQAKELGCPEAFYNLGVLSMGARGIQGGRYPILFKRGSELGNSLCMFYYAKCLETGDGFPASPTQADTWYLKAAELLKTQADEHSRPAMYCYAQCLENGKGVARDPAAATTWYSKAASAGEPLAMQWCFSHKVDFRVSGDSQSPPKLALPHRVTIGTSPERKLP